MKAFDEILTDAQNAITVKRVYGEPYQQNGVTFIPAAAVRGGGGGGEGDPTENTPGGRGLGMGMAARPVGAYQIKRRGTGSCGGPHQGHGHRSDRGDRRSAGDPLDRSQAFEDLRRAGANRQDRKGLNQRAKEFPAMWSSTKARCGAPSQPPRAAKISYTIQAGQKIACTNDSKYSQNTSACCQ